MPKVVKEVEKSLQEERVKLNHRLRELGDLLEVRQRRINDIQAEAKVYVDEFNANKKRLDEIELALNPKEAPKESEVKS